MRQQRYQHRQARGWLWGAMLALLIIAAIIGWRYQTKEAPVKHAQAETKAHLTQVLAHAHGTQTKEKIGGGQAIFVLPKGHQVPASLRATVKSKLAAMPKHASDKAVVATVALTAAPLGLTTMDTSLEQLYTQDTKMHRTVTQEAPHTLDAAGKRATVAALVTTDEARRAINYAAKQALVSGKKLSAPALAAVLSRPLLSKLTATNFVISDHDLTIQDAAGKTEVTLPLTAVKSYLKDSQAQPAAGKVIALTFDDGPDPRTTPQVLQILRQHQAKATFFMVGTGIAHDPQLARQVADEGNEVGTHTYNHPYLPGLSPAAALDETYGKNIATYYAAFDRLPPFLRPPYGAISKANAAQIELPAIQWNIDSQDWKSRNREMIIARIKAAARSGSIILMHDIQPATVAALPTVINDLKQQGYQFKTVSELLGQQLLPSHQYFSLGDQRLI